MWLMTICRPLPPALAPLLKAQLEAVLEQVCKAFPPAQACLAAAAAGSGSLHLQAMASFRGRPRGIAAIRDEHDDDDVTAELSGGESALQARDGFSFASSQQRELSKDGH